MLKLSYVLPVAPTPTLGNPATHHVTPDGQKQRSHEHALPDGNLQISAAQHALCGDGHASRPVPSNM